MTTTDRLNWDRCFIFKRQLSRCKLLEGLTHTRKTNSQINLWVIPMNRCSSLVIALKQLIFSTTLTWGHSSTWENGPLFSTFPLASDLKLWSDGALVPFTICSSLMPAYYYSGSCQSAAYPKMHAGQSRKHPLQVTHPWHGWDSHTHICRLKLSHSTRGWTLENLSANSDSQVAQSN